MTSDSTFPHRFTEVADLARPDHYYLTEGDACYCIGEYAVHEDTRYSRTNNLIWNFKKNMDRRGKPDWWYKEQAIQQIAATIGAAVGPDALDRLTFVPIPPSKAKDDPLHDDRLARMLRATRPNRPPDVRELVVQTLSTGAAHEDELPRIPREIEKVYRIDDTLITPKPKTIAIVDDILTTGAHFRAAKSILSTRFPNTPILGLFVARST